MEARQLDNTRREDGCWATVRRWHYLSAEGKLAWWLLWQRAGGKPTTLTCHIAAVGEDQGASDASRSGRRSLETLAVHGLIQVLEKDRGLWTVYLNDPVIVEQARLVRAAGDAQGELYPEEAKSSQPEPVGTVPFPRQAPPQLPALSPVDSADKQAVVAQPPPVAPADNDKQAVGAPSPPVSAPQTGGGCATTAEKQAAVAQLPPAPRSEVRGKRVEYIPRSDVPRSSYLGAGGSCATAAELQKRVDAAGWERAKQQAARDIPLAAGALDQVVAKAIAQRSAQPAAAHQLAQLVFREVNDPNLKPCVCEKIAWAVTEGVYPRQKLFRILDQLRKKFGMHSAKDRGMYFVGVMRKSFRECGLELFERRPPTVAAPQSPGEEVPLP